ncbi:hypothetical protein LDI01_26250 [Lentilactobacillus diolivorans]|uniref:Uncharacterized protein n=1 Tax=Lentilactobacillus diolivorans TaxID=179838 RepID=A0ABQ0XG30_9LACO|nr:hypothetical protein LDI01_26250 [Lentilactobacillus diolivorans]
MFGNNRVYTNRDWARGLLSQSFFDQLNACKYLRAFKNTAILLALNKESRHDQNESKKIFDESWGYLSNNCFNFIWLFNFYNILYRVSSNA